MMSQVSPHPNRKRSDDLRRQVAVLVFAVFAFNRVELSLLTAESHGMNPCPGHVELEANFLPQKLADIGVLLPANRVIQGISLDAN